MQKLFNLKDMEKWENPDIERLNEHDRKELLRDMGNVSLILP